MKFAIVTSGGLPHKSDGDARRLTLGCKLQMLVSLKMFGMESLYLPVQLSLSTVMHEEMYKICLDTGHTEISFRGQFKLEPHPHWSPLGV